MSFVLPLLGLSFGLLVASVGVGLWDVRRSVPGLSRAARMMRWIAAGLLFSGAVLRVVARQDAFDSMAYVALMAAIATLPLPAQSGDVAWVPPARTFPALWLAGAVLVLAGEKSSTGGGPAPMVLAFALCGGLAARALGGALVALFAVDIETWSAEATHLLLTLLAGGGLLVDLGRQGGWLGARRVELAMVGPWLAWVAVHFFPRRWPRVRAGLLGFAALLLISTVFSIA